MIYLIWYLAIGFIALIGATLLHFKSKISQSKITDDVFGLLYPERKKFWYRAVNSVGVPILAGLWVVVAWPVVLLLEAKRLLSREKPLVEIEIPEFAIRQSDLLERLTIQQIEEREKVIDPLFAVPDLPFGFLHGVWEKFLDNVVEGDELWAFSVREKWPNGLEKLTTGYVIVKGSIIDKYFSTLSKVYGYQ